MNGKTVTPLYTIKKMSVAVIFFVLYYDYCKVHDFLKSITQVILVYNNFIGNTS